MFWHSVWHSIQHPAWHSIWHSLWHEFRSRRGPQHRCSGPCVPSCGAGRGDQQRCGGGEQGEEGEEGEGVEPLWKSRDTQEGKGDEQGEISGVFVCCFLKGFWPIEVNMYKSYPGQQWRESMSEDVFYLDIMQKLSFYNMDLKSDLSWIAGNIYSTWHAAHPWAPSFKWCWEGWFHTVHFFLWTCVKSQFWMAEFAFWYFPSRRFIGRVYRLWRAASDWEYCPRGLLPPQSRDKKWHLTGNRETDIQTEIMFVALWQKKHKYSKYLKCTGFPKTWETCYIIIYAYWIQNPKTCG